MFVYTHKRALCAKIAHKSLLALKRGRTNRAAIQVIASTCGLPAGVGILSFGIQLGRIAFRGLPSELCVVCLGFPFISGMTQEETCAIVCVGVWTTLESINLLLFSFCIQIGNLH